MKINEFGFQFGEKIVTVCNPNSKVKTSELMKRAGIRRTKIKDTLDFVVDFELGTPPEKHYHSMDPESTTEVPQSVADLMIKDKRQRGICIVGKVDPYGDMIAGLEEAARFWNEMGTNQIILIKRNLGHNDEEFRQNQRLYENFLINVEREKEVLKQIGKFEKLREKQQEAFQAKGKLVQAEREKDAQDFILEQENIPKVPSKE